MYITINSEFKPFTYDELTKPLNDYTEAYNKVEEQYATLAQQTEAWKNIATQENSPEAYAMYKKYSDELNAVVDDFSRGMTIQNRGKLSGLKSRYASEITPISIAYDAMQKANAYRDTIKGQDDSAVFNVDRYNSLDDFLNGQMADNTFISGKNLQTDIATQILSESYNEYEKLITKGYSEKAALNKVAKGEWINEDGMLDNIYTSMGITNEEAASKIRTYADKGIAQGISSFTVDTKDKLFEKEIERAKINGNDKDKPVFDRKEAAVLLYNALGKDQLYQTEDKETTVTDENTDYASTETKTFQKTHSYTDDEKYAKMVSDEIGRTAINLMEHLDVNTVMKYMKDYESDITVDKSNKGSGTTFEDYLDLIASDYTSSDIKKTLQEMVNKEIDIKNISIKEYILSNE